MKHLLCKPATLEAGTAPKKGNSATHKKRKLTQPPTPPTAGLTGTFIALEPRILFDGAALATGAEVVQDTTTQDQPGVPDPQGETSTDSTHTDSADQDTLWTSGLSPSAPSDRKEIVFIDTRVEHYQTLMDGIDPAAEVILLDARRDGIEQIAEALKGRSDIDAVHLIGEGTEAELYLGTAFLTNDSISDQYAALLSQIGQSLSAEADLLIYGCNFGRGQAGLSAMQALADLTGADIAASTDRTGHVSEYANWQLEVSTGFIETSIMIGQATQDTWEGVLATYTVTNTNNSGAGSLRQAILDANGNPGTDTISFNIALTDPNHLYYRDNGVGGTFGAPVATTLSDAAITDFDADYMAGTARSWYRITLSGSDLNVTQGVIIDGSTQAGYDAAKGPIIELNAAGVASGDPNGLTLTTGASTVRGLVINLAGDDAIEIDVNAGGSTIVGNYLGTDVSGLQTTFGNRYGITVKSDDNTIGGTTAADRNIIAGNSTGGDSFGIGFWQNADSNVVQGNYIGVGADGTTAMGNRQGITFQNTAHDNMIGGEGIDEGNIIANNSMNGVDVIAGTGNAIVRNSIYSNTLLGINLGTAGITANDSGDGDSGANNLQNFPVLTRAVTDSTGMISIDGTLNSTASTNFRIEFFRNTTGDASGNGEGETYLGFTEVTTNGSGNATFNVTLSAIVSSGNAICATATVKIGASTYRDTSEFALNVAATAGTLTVTTTNDVSNGDTSSVAALIASDGGDGISLREAITAANNTAGTDTIAFNISGSGPHTINVLSALPTISDAVLIDGWSEPDFSGTPVIELNGTSAGGGVHGLTISTGSGSTIRGLVINRFGSDALNIDADNVTIVGNYLGTDVTGTVDLGNGDDGIDYDGNNGIIGGLTAVERNIISGNTGDGINFGGSSTGSVVWGNYIGTDVTGTLGVGNTANGILISGSNNTIGGATAFARNIISGNGGHGIYLNGAGADGNTIYGNYIGTNSGGTAALGNTGDGIRLDTGASANFIGDGASGVGNVISANTGYGITLIGSTTSANSMTANLIGLNAAGTSVTGLLNGEDGIYISSAAGNTIGGSTVNARNIINAAFGKAAIDISGSLSVGTIVRGNFIGTNSAGTTRLSGSSFGISVGSNAVNTVIGGTSANDANVVAGYAVTGISIGVSSTGTTIQGNYIGTDVSGTLDLTTGLYGISVQNGLTNTLIGGVVAGAGNTIAFQGSNGIHAFASAGTGIAILGNEMYGNNGLGIDLNADGVTANDVGDGDTGPNNLQNFPVLTSANTDGAANVYVAGTLNSTATTNYRIEFFASTTPDGSGYGEGEVYIGFINVTTDGSGNVNFFQNLTAAVSAGTSITATATVDLGGGNYGDTSEFGANIIALNMSTLVVDTTSDVLDGNTSSISNLLSNRGADNQISLREAITAVNNTAGTDTIHFNILDVLVGGAHTIQVGNPGDGSNGALPDITGVVIIDGTAEPDFGSTPIIELNGTSAGAVDGLRLITGSDGSTIRGLVINQFSSQGIEINNSDGNTIAGNYIGTDVTGTVDLGNGSAGLYIFSAQNTIIGGTIAADRNLISGNQGSGILRQGSNGGNVIQGNYIGTDATGTLDLGNTQNGIAFSGSGTDTIGGALAGAGNVISGNTMTGISIGAGADGVTIQGNFIGTNAAGTGALANSSDGISVNANNTQIGGSTVLARNVISGNTSDGIELSGDNNIVEGNYIGLDGTGMVALGNSGHGVWITSGAISNVVGGNMAGAKNYISGNSGSGVFMDAGAGFNTISGNTIGLAVDGLTDRGNVGHGVFTNTGNNTIGGTTINERNVIGGNAGDGIHIATGGDTNTIIGNYIGLDEGGTLDRGNDGDGIYLASEDNLIGGTTTAERNVISGNTLAGVYLTGATVSPNTLSGNYIGTNWDGSAAVANSIGITVENGTNNIIGGLVAGAGNLISGNNVHGIYLNGGGTTGTQIYRNTIGTNAAVNAKLANGFDGIRIEGGAGTAMIGDGLGNGNVIAGNSQRGISLTSGNSNNIIQGNYIGTNLLGASNLGNTMSGIEIGNFVSSHNLVGGTTAGQGNVIAYNDDGIIVISGTGDSIGNSILGNSIHSNLGLGVNLVDAGDLINGITANDVGDGDTGSNNLQNYPVLTSVTTTGTQVTINGTLNSSASTTYRIEIFASVIADGTAYGEAERYLGSATVTTDGSGNGTISSVLPAVVAGGEFVTATATVIDNVGQVGIDDALAYGDTSEFAQNVVANTAPVNTVPGSQVVDEDTALTITGLSVTDVDGNLSTVQLAVTQGTVTVMVSGAATISAGANGTSTLTLSGSQTDINATLASVSYQGNLNYTGADTLTVTSTDGNSATDVDGVGITVTAVNDVPVLTNLSGDTLAYTEGDGAQVIEQGSNAAVTDVDSADLDTGTLTVSFQAGSDSAEDVLAIRDQGTGAGQIGVSGSTVTYQGVTIGTVTGGSGGTDLVITLNANAEATAAGALVQNITYENTDTANPTLGSRTVRYVLTDGDGGTSANYDTTVTMAAVNDVPVLTNLSGDTLAYTEGDGAQVIEQGSNAAVTDVDSADLDTGTLTVSFQAGSDSAEDVLAIRDQGTGAGQIGVSGSTVTYQGVTIGTVTGGSGGTDLVITLNANAEATAAGALVQNITYENTDTANPTLGSRTVRYVLTDGDGGTSANYDTTVTMAAVNDVPVLTNLSGDTLAYTEGDGAQVIEQGSNAAVTDVDSADLDTGTLTVSFQAGSDSAEDVLAIRDQGTGAGQIGVSGSTVTYQGVTIGTVTGGSGGTDLVITLNANAEATAAGALVQNITYENTDTANPTLGSRTVRYVLTDGDGGTSANYDTTVTMAAVNDVPVLTNLSGDTLAYTEGDGAQVIEQGSNAAVTDVDSADLDTGTLTVSFQAGSDSAEDVLAIRDQGTGAGQIGVSGSTVTYQGVTIGTVTGGSGGTDLVITLNANAEATAAGALVQNITYENTDTANPTLGSRTVRYVLTDGDGGTSANYDTTVTMAAVNDVPVLTNLSGDTLAYTEGDGAQVIEQGSNAAVTDVDSADLDTGTLTVSFQAGSDSAEDVLAIRDQGTGAGQIGVSGSTVTYQGVTIGTVTGGSGGTDLVITLNANAEATAAGALVQNITYENTDTANPTLGSRTVRYVLTDGDGGTSANYDTTVTMAAVNDVPVNTVPGAQVVAEDTALTITGLSVTDVDGNLSAVQLAVGQGTVTVSGAATISAGANGTSSLTLSGSEADINATLASVSYQGNLNYTGADTLTVTSTDGNSATDVDMVGITVTGVNDAPVLTSDGGGPTAAVNAPENQTGVTTVTATDVDLPADTLTYTITGGADAARFSLDPTSGVLTFIVAPDIDAPTDAGANNVYDVVVQVSDGNGGADSQAIAVTVTDANDVPIITSNGGGATAVVNVAENQTSVTTVTATDVDVPGDTLTFTILGGADAARFSLDPTSGVLTFTVPPDFETPADADANNVYEVTVQVSDGNGGVDSQMIQVTVTDVQEGLSQLPPPQPGPTPTPAPSPPPIPESPLDTNTSPMGTPQIESPGPFAGQSSPGRDLSRHPHLQPAPDWNRVLEIAPFLRPAAFETTSEQILSYAPAPVLLSHIELGHEFLQQLNAFSDQLAETTQQTIDERSLFVKMMEYTGLGVSGVLVAWLVRSGTLVASMLAALPAWRSFDPIAILDMDKQGRENLTKKMKEAAEKEAWEHQGLDRILDQKNIKSPPPFSTVHPGSS
ncbi:DUF4347 domain-containing protein [Nitrospira sp. MA-1]|nr:DUF4347 domain-containing protein [Nitrospira sp. MA-1]